MNLNQVEDYVRKHISSGTHLPALSIDETISVIACIPEMSDGLQYEAAKLLPELGKHSELTLDVLINHADRIDAPLIWLILGSFALPGVVRNLDCHVVDRLLANEDALVQSRVYEIVIAYITFLMSDTVDSDSVASRLRGISSDPEFVMEVQSLYLLLASSRSMQIMLSVMCAKLGEVLSKIDVESKVPGKLYVRTIRDLLQSKFYSN